MGWLLGTGAVFITGAHRRCIRVDLLACTKWRAPFNRMAHLAVLRGHKRPVGGGFLGPPAGSALAADNVSDSRRGRTPPFFSWDRANRSNSRAQSFTICRLYASWYREQAQIRVAIQRSR